MYTAPKMNPAAWFALAVAAPMLLLALGAAASGIGASRAAGIWAAMLLLPAIVLAVRALERRPGPNGAADAPGADLTRAFCLTTGQACGLLFVVAAGAPFSGESVAVGLAMAATPLALAVAGDVWRRLVPPLGVARDAQIEVSAARNWTLEWAQGEAQRAPAPQPVTPLWAARAFAPPPPRPASGVTLAVRPMEVDETWMRHGERPRPAAVVDWRHGVGGGWTAGSGQRGRAARPASLSRVQ
jgi:hypothetical protein